MRVSAVLIVLITFMMVSPGWGQEAQTTDNEEVTSNTLALKGPQPAWVVNSVEGAVYLVKAGASPTAFQKLEDKDPVPLYQGDRLTVAKGSQVVIFDGLKKITLKPDEGQNSISREVPAPPPQGSLFERLLASSAQRQRQAVAAGFAIRPGISPNARIASPRRDGNFVGDLPPNPMIKLRSCNGHTITLRLKGLSSKDATSGTTLSEMTLDENDSVQTVEWDFDEATQETVLDTNWFLMELLADGTVKASRRLSRMGADLKAQFEADQKELEEKLEVEEMEELETNPAQEYLEQYYDLVGGE